ncbi:hypothetical protein [Roseibacillus ishigakijimensis]|uniref:Uncharacterized protein n=1 Tax=Roseibacillus ishigakijimensis TaxID=454146 RepID=A0A934RPD5_9BACT|nr:hypothetical protein [Roseibacillus ishigakijimensis]MBK1832674.1 hypothetical protein [Roseibacillus ishigakijimensis]
MDAFLADYAALPGGGPKALGGFEFQPATVLAGIPALNYLRVIGAPFQGLYSQLHGLRRGPDGWAATQARCLHPS